MSFIKKHRSTITTVSTIVLALLAGLIIGSIDLPTNDRQAKKDLSKSLHKNCQQVVKYSEDRGDTEAENDRRQICKSYFEQLANKDLNELLAEFTPNSLLPHTDSNKGIVSSRLGKVDSDQLTQQLNADLRFILDSKTLAEWLEISDPLVLAQAYITVGQYSHARDALRLAPFETIAFKQDTTSTPENSTIRLGTAKALEAISLVGDAGLSSETEGKMMTMLEARTLAQQAITMGVDKDQLQAWWVEHAN